MSKSIQERLKRLEHLYKYLCCNSGGSSSISYIEPAIIDSYVGSRLRPTDPNSNGFYFSRDANESVGYTALNPNGGNGAVATLGTGIDSSPYIKNMVIAKFGANYYLSILAGKGGLLGTEEVFVGSTNGGDVSVLTGADFASLSRKFIVKLNGTINIPINPILTGGYGAPVDLLVRTSGGDIFKAAAILPSQEMKIGMNLDGSWAGSYYNNGFSPSIFGGSTGTTFDVTLGSGIFNGIGNTEVYFHIAAVPGYTIIPTVISIASNQILYTLAAIDNATGVFIMLDSGNASSCIQNYINIIIKQ